MLDGLGPAFRRAVFRLARIPALRTLAIIAVAWLTVFGLLKERLWRDPRSGFFEDATVYDLGYSAERQKEAREWATHGDSYDNSVEREPAICAAFVTYNRPQRQYLNESIGSMLAGLTANERDALNVRLLFAHSDPSVHPDWDLEWLSSLDSWSGYNTSEPKMELVQQMEEERNFYVKGVFDYTYVLEECLNQTNAPFIAIFEDDIIFAEGWLPRTVKAIQELSERSQVQNWLYLRLFYTETALGWGTESDFWYRNMMGTFFLAMCVTLAVLLVARASLPQIRLGFATIAVLVFVAAPAFTQLIFMVGKYNIHPLSGVQRMDKFGCCTQALVFPRLQAQNLLAALSGRNGQTDSMIESYADENDLQRYALAPQVVQHVGLVSSRDNDPLNTRSTWAFWFEAQRAQLLHQEHLKMEAAMNWRSLLGVA